MFHGWFIFNYTYVPDLTTAFMND